MSFTFNVGDVLEFEVVTTREANKLFNLADSLANRYITRYSTDGNDCRPPGDTGVGQKASGIIVRRVAPPNEQPMIGAEKYQLDVCWPDGSVQSGYIAYLPKCADLPGYFKLKTRAEKRNRFQKVIE